MSNITQSNIPPQPSCRGKPIHNMHKLTKMCNEQSKKHKLAKTVLRMVRSGTERLATLIMFLHLEHHSPQYK